MKLLRYLAALAPLTLGVALSGCGGLLGAVEGEAPAALPANASRFVPQPTVINVPATFTVTGQCTGLVSAATVFFVKPGPTQVTITPQAPTLSGNTYSILVGPLPDAQRLNSGGLWVVAVTSGGVTDVLTFVPPATNGGSVIAPPCTPAQTIATGLLLQTVTPSFQITTGLASVVNGLSSSAGAFNFTPTGANGLAVLQSVQTANLASSIKSIKFDNPNGFLFIGESVIETVSATVTVGAQTQTGVAVPVTFSITPASNTIVNAVAVGGNAIWLRGNSTGTVTLKATPPTGSTASAISHTIAVTEHPQGHGQGGGSGL